MLPTDASFCLIQPPWLLTPRRLASAAVAAAAAAKLLCPSAIYVTHLSFLLKPHLAATLGGEALIPYAAA